MKRFILLSVTVIAFINIASAQNYFTKNGKVSFYSHTNIEDIEAVNNQVVSVLNAGTGEIKFSMVIKGFLFKKALMQEHFNENYMESDKFPKSTFNGTITDLTKLNTSKEGTYTVNVNGDLTIHGVTRKVTIPATIQVNKGGINATTSFKILLSDYNISIPTIVRGNISKNIEIKVECNYDTK